MNPENQTPFDKNLMLFSLMSSMGKLPYFNFMSSMSPFTNIPIPQNPTSDYHQKPILPPLTEEPKIKKEQPDPISEETLEQKPEKPEEEFEREKPSFIEKNEGIHKILKYFVQNIGRVRSNRINGEREKFLNNPELRQIFDLLMKKYIMSNKTKEEKIKYILRKAFKYLGNKLRKEHYLTKQVKSKKEFDQIFNDFYMSEKKSLLETIKEDEVKISESKNFKLIFTKESFNKTMNSNFLNTIFSKECFVEDYKEFLNHFKEMSVQDNEDKLNKAVKKLSSLKNLNKCNELSHRFFKRMPWLEVWIEEAEMIAKKLPDKNSSLLTKEPFIRQMKNNKKNKDNQDNCEQEQKNNLKRKRANSL